MKWFYLLLLPIFFACNHRLPEADNVLLDNDIKQKYTYKSGSYWIYRDSLSGEEDSFFLKSNYFKSLPAKTVGSIDHEGIAYIVQSYTKGTDTIILNVGLEANTALRASYTKKSKENSTSFFLIYSNNDKLSLAVPITEVPKYIDNSGICFVKKTNELSLGPNTFQNVYQIKYQTTSNNLSTCYFNDSVGFIKISAEYKYSGSIHKEVWELQKWKIIK